MYGKHYFNIFRSNIDFIRILVYTILQYFAKTKIRNAMLQGKVIWAESTVGKHPVHRQDAFVSEVIYGISINQPDL